jgi:DNA repair protein RadC
MAPSLRDSGPDACRDESTLCSQRTCGARCAGPSRRYRLQKTTWTVVREPGQPSPRLLSAPAAVAELARDLICAHDDDKEHFWVVLLSAQNHYLLHTEVSVGSQSATIVHPREVFGPALPEGAASRLVIHNHP